MIPTLLTTWITINPKQWLHKKREWKSEQNRTPVEESINRSLLDLEMEEHGCDDTTEQEELLQLPSDGD